MDPIITKDSLETIANYVSIYGFATSAGVLGYTLYLIFKDNIDKNKQIKFDFMKDITKYKTK